ncbi:helix-turn-helix transcriptional regulator [Georgenia sp. 311]|uniref:helix-turn-helix transcriptional regulator n=1 Tax=Georgenia sp. 311 TaxID=2585134 RepID=UPI0011119987|nr:LuxR C-terminal-related transcriptional regulator [Georgenia sp. 311]TNC17242.1 helix-turn-helix transcriptional regulator [Georgenia sp. 311]
MVGLEGAGGRSTDEDAVGAAFRWLALGRDVVVRGADGSGRTRVLGAAQREASRRGMTAVLLAASGDSPYAALRAHPSVVAERLGSATALAGWLTEELQARRSLLLLDDVDLLDQASAEVVLQASRSSGAMLLATTRADLTRLAPGPVADLVAERAPAEVHLLPLGFRAVSRLLAEELRGPPDVALTSSVTARSGGNPRVVRALVDAARVADAVGLVGGRWRATGSLDDVPLDPVAHALLPRLGREQVAALELLACAGPLTREVAEELLGAGLLDRLAEVGRVRQLPSGEEDTVNVDPPALAAALRARLGEERRRRLEEVLADRAGARWATPEHGDLLTGGASESYWQWAADLVGVVTEQASATEAALRIRWQTRPTPAHANAYLGMLLRRRADAQVAAVLAGTELSEEDPVDDVVTFHLHELRWAAWQGEGEEEVLARLRLPGPHSRALHRLLHERTAGLEELLAGTGEWPSPVLHRAAALARAARLVELGHPELALDVCDEEDPARPPTELDHQLEGVRGTALIMLDRSEEADVLARDHLTRALHERDLLGIRVHACLLTECLLDAGDLDAAARVLSLFLRVGPGGPLDATFFRRGLTVGTILLVHQGTVDVAEMLLDALDATPRGFQPVIHSLAPLARAALADSRGDPGTAEQLWRAGEDYLAQGAVQAALVCWVFCPPPLPAERLARLRETWSACPSPRLAPYLRLHEALAAGDQDAVVAALPGATLDVAGLVRNAVAALDPEHAAQEAVRALDPRLRTGAEDDPGEALSPREREIAALAGAGSTNRQIATALSLSVRTVENHVSNALHKLGFTGRTELARWLATDGHPPSTT